MHSEQDRQGTGKLNSGTDLVTVSAGGNDVGFGTIIGVCAQGILADCQAAAAGALLKAQGVDIEATVVAIHSRAKHARIAWIGHPHLFAANGGGIMTPAAAAVFNQGTDALNNVFAGKVALAALKSGARTQYVNAAPNFTGHEIGSADSWFNLNFSVPALEQFNFHPTANGYQKGYFPAMASQINFSKTAFVPAS